MNPIGQSSGFENDLTKEIEKQNLQSSDKGSSKGVKKDWTEAAKWYHKAARQGEAKAQFALGLIYEKGKVGKKDLPLAAKWYDLAAKQGHANAAHKLKKLKKSSFS